LRNNLFAARATCVANNVVHNLDQMLLLLLLLLSLLLHVCSCSWI
jgi:hypothetical protein